MHDILVIIGAYLPGTLAGGPVRTTANMVGWLGDEYRFRILTADRDFNTTQPYPGIEPGQWYPVGKAQVRYLTPAEQSLAALARIIRSTPHDLVYLDSVLATFSVKYLLLRRLGSVPRKPLILAPRGNLAAGALRLKAWKKRPFLLAARAAGLYRDICWHASSKAETQQIIDALNVPAQRIRAISNLPDPTLVQSEMDLRPPKQPGIVKMVTLSRVSRKKNIHFILRALSDVQAHVEYDLYGPLEDPAYWDECQRLIARLPSHIRVCYRGAVPFDRVTRTLSRYHLFTLPTLGENFGHVILEALCSGCALLISDQTPWRGLETRGVGWDLPLRRPDFVDAVHRFASLDAGEFTQMSKLARQMGRDYVYNRGLVEATWQFFQQAIENANS